MAITRERKEQLVKLYVEQLQSSQGVILVDYRGLSVPSTERLRRELREQEVTLHVIKNRLLRLALTQVGMDMPQEWLVGPAMAAFCHGPVPPAAKVINTLAKEFESLVVKGGLLDAEQLSPEQVKALANLPTREVMLAQVLATINAPASQTVGVVAGGVTFAMLTFIVPVFAKMFSGLGAELPAPTQAVLNLSNFLRSNVLTIIFAIIAALVAFKFALKRPDFRLMFDRFKLHVPLLGNLIRKSSISRFTRTLSTLLSSGVSILDALEITAKTSGNLVIQNAIRKSMVSIAEGETITAPLKDSGVFPPMVTQMISVGEKTGGLDEMLSKIADFYDEEVDGAVAALTSVIEPVIIVVMGAVIGGILIAMYLPMFDIIGKIN